MDIKLVEKNETENSLVKQEAGSLIRWLIIESLRIGLDFIDPATWSLTFWNVNFPDFLWKIILNVMNVKLPPVKYSY